MAQGLKYSRIATWNIQTIRSRADQIEERALHYRISILGLTEVRRDPVLDFDEYKWVFKRKAGSAYGVGFLIHLPLLERVRVNAWKV
jgi:exonuclease III